MSHYSWKTARKECFRILDETCPAVDKALLAAEEAVTAHLRGAYGDLDEDTKSDLDLAIARAFAKAMPDLEVAVKSQTESLRDAWINTMEERLNLDDQLADAEKRAEIAAHNELHAQGQIAELEQELENLQAAHEEQCADLRADRQATYADMQAEIDKLKGEIKCRQSIA